MAELGSYGQTLLGGPILGSKPKYTARSVDLLLLCVCVGGVTREMVDFPVFAWQLVSSYVTHTLEHITA